MKNLSLFLRSLLFMTVMTIFTPVWTCVIVLSLPLPFRQRYWVASRWNAFAIWLARTVCGIRYRVKGYENLPDAPVILLCKHQSAWETIFMIFGMPRPLSFVLKKELLYLPFFGWALAMMRMIPIDRKQGLRALRKVTALGRQRLANGQWIIMFPEGTRMPVGQKGKYHGSGAKLAIDTGALVVPIAVNSGEFWPKNSFIKKPGVVTISIGKPISPDGHTQDSLIRQVETWIESEMRIISPYVYRRSAQHAKA